jgi:hypothetical protein
MNKITVIQILQRWPDRPAILSDVSSVDESLSLVAVHRWFQRGAIPAKYWKSLIMGADCRGFNVTATEMVVAHSPAEKCSRMNADHLISDVNAKPLRAVG